jgi:CcmD family protein
MNAIASNQTFIIAAYAITWVVLLGYLFRLTAVARRARASGKGA